MLKWQVIGQTFYENISVEKTIISDHSLSNNRTYNYMSLEDNIRSTIKSPMIMHVPQTKHIYLLCLRKLTCWLYATTLRLLGVVVDTIYF